ncbi:hypothetical protein [uncultured Cocleimonas sp.]|uniref:hypothetical protein n=1 Tax=uncultured Cocleimonas sp. TaxID=1051587 RepID=UPI00262C15C5|nr:hypothetical protein [uncultured Cocleimonas sp.]
MKKSDQQSLDSIINQLRLFQQDHAVRFKESDFGFNVYLEKNIIKARMNRQRMDERLLKSLTPYINNNSPFKASLEEDKSITIYVPALFEIKPRPYNYSKIMFHTDSEVIKLSIERGYEDQLVIPN